MLVRLFDREEMSCRCTAAVLKKFVLLLVPNQNQNFHVAHLGQLNCFFENVSLSFALQVGPSLSILNKLFGSFLLQLIQFRYFFLVGHIYVYLYI